MKSSSLTSAFTDTRGKWQHITAPVSQFDESKFEEGQGVRWFLHRRLERHRSLRHAADARCWQRLHRSLLEETTLVLICDVIEPTDGKAYERDPRSIAKRAEVYLKATGLGDTAYFGPEPEFFLFDDVRWSTEPQNTFYAIDEYEAPWNSGLEARRRQPWSPQPRQGRLLPSAPNRQHARPAQRNVPGAESVGIPVEVHHHEVAGAGQCEIGTKFSTLVERADWTLLQKYVIQNVANSYGKTATFMP